MAISRYYSSTAGKMTLVGAITNSATSLVVDTTVGLPASTPFTLIIDPGISKEEIVTCTAVGGTTLTIIRGEDGTTGQSHSNGAEIRHGISARDLGDSRAHENATAGAHGTSGSVVGTTSTQTLTGKTMDGGSNTFTNIPKTALPGTTAYTDATNTYTKGPQTINIDAAGNVGHVVKGAASQTADLVQWKNNAGTTLGKVDASGNVTGATIISSGDVSGTTGTFSGNITAANLTTLLNPPRCFVYTTAAAHSLPDGTWYCHPFNAEGYDTDNMHNTASNTSRVTFTTAGTYTIMANVSYSTNSVGGRALHLRKNANGAVGGGTSLTYTEVGPSSNISTIIPIIYEGTFAAGEYVELFVYHSAGTNLDIGPTATWISARWAGPQ